MSKANLTAYKTYLTTLLSSSANIISSTCDYEYWEGTSGNTNTRYTHYYLYNNNICSFLGNYVEKSYTTTYNSDRPSSVYIVTTDAL